MKQYKKIDHELISINSRSLEQHENHSPDSNNTANKGSSGSLNKHNKSPYLQSIVYAS